MKLETSFSPTNQCNRAQKRKTMVPAKSDAVLKNYQTKKENLLSHHVLRGILCPCDKRRKCWSFLCCVPLMRKVLEKFDAFFDTFFACLWWWSKHPEPILTMNKEISCHRKNFFLIAIIVPKLFFPYEWLMRCTSVGEKIFFFCFSKG